MALRKLYPEIDPYSSGYLKVSELHTLYWEQCGNPDGVPILFLHGGPGAGSSVRSRRYFDPDFYRIIIFDQRGCGRSEPVGELKENSPEALVEDIEKLRKHFKLEKWHIFGGSWGSTLALLYATEYPDHCISLILRGIALLQQEEIDWFANGIQTIFPEAWEKFIGFLPSEERDNPIQAYYTRLTDEDPHIHMPAARVWSRYEEDCAMMFPESVGSYDPERDKINLNIARIEAHYFLHHQISEENCLLKRVERINHIPATIIQGRYDIICPIKTAHKLHKAWPEADFVIVPDGAHSSADPSVRSRLLEATDNARSINS